jgi:hypothetical protein
LDPVELALEVRLEVRGLFVPRILHCITIERRSKKRIRYAQTAS